MAHHHGHLRNLHRRREDNDESQNSDGVETVVQVVYKTMSKTFSGDAVMVTQGSDDASSLVDTPSRKTKTSSAEDAQTTDDSETTTADDPTETDTPTSTDEITKTTSHPKHTATTLMVASSSPKTSPGVSSTAALGIANVSSTSSPSATATGAASSGGMAGGTAAGITLGVLLAVGAILAAILFVYRRKKKQMAAQNSDNEKPGPYETPLPAIPAVNQSTTSIRTARTLSTAPRLSLRPVTQFSPTFSENRKSGGNLLTVAAAAAPAQQSQDRVPSPEAPRSPWERPGAGNASGAQDPFQDPVARSVSPPQNPFGNDAAIDSTPSTSRAVSATSGAPDHLNNFGNPGPAIAAAEAAPIVAMAAAPIVRKEVAAPPSFKPMSEAAPPSPAWTEDVPPSPGPAPSGPLPMAGPNGAAPGPNNVHRVQLEFKPSMQDELELQVGQLVRLLHEYDDGWALCTRLDRSQQGVVPRTCVSKHPVKPRTGPPRNGPPGPRMRGPPINSPMGPGGVPQPRPLTPSGSSNGRMSPHPPALSPANGRMSPGPRSMSPGPRAMSPVTGRNSPGPVMRPGPNRGRANSNAPYAGPPRSMSPGSQGRGRSHSNAPYAGPPRSMSPGPYGGGPQMAPPPKMGRPRSNSASSVMAKRASPPGPSPLALQAGSGGVVPRKPLPGQAI